MASLMLLVFTAGLPEDSVLTREESGASWAFEVSVKDRIIEQAKSRRALACT
jgi:hypothetical protein